jgi:hypothetical protein
MLAWSNKYAVAGDITKAKEVEVFTSSSWFKYPIGWTILARQPQLEKLLNGHK